MIKITKDKLTGNTSIIIQGLHITRVQDSKLAKCAPLIYIDGEVFKDINVSITGCYLEVGSEGTAIYISEPKTSIIEKE